MPMRLGVRRIVNANASAAAKSRPLPFTPQRKSRKMIGFSIQTNNAMRLLRQSGATLFRCLENGFWHAHGFDGRNYNAAKDLLMVSRRLTACGCAGPGRCRKEGV